MQWTLHIYHYCRLDPYGLAGQWVTDALNPSGYTFEVSPVFTVLEEVVMLRMREMLGYPGGQGDGVFCPGGSMANGYAINLARYKAFPSAKVIMDKHNYLTIFLNVILLLTVF
jgi:sulfinoalanine decarboxylase